MIERQYGLYEAGNDVDDIKVICERLSHLIQILSEITESELSALVSLSRENNTLVWIAARLTVVRSLIDTICFASGDAVQEIDAVSRKIWEAAQKETNSQTSAKMK